MKKYHYPCEGGSAGGRRRQQPNVERVINSNVLGVPGLTNADLAAGSEAYKSSHVS